LSANRKEAGGVPAFFHFRVKPIQLGDAKDAA
jgi:hypothetical protein